MGKKKRILILICIYCIVLIWVSLYAIIRLIDRAAVISFKKLYSAYTQALYNTVYQMDGDIGCYYSTDKDVASDFSNCSRFYKNFATNLRVIKYCKENSLSDGCIPMYKKYPSNQKCAGFSEKMVNLHDQSFVMNDNSSLIVFNSPKGVSKPIFAVDSNGKLIPNNPGYDLFTMTIIKNSYGNYAFHPNVVYCLPNENAKIKNIQDVYK